MKNSNAFEARITFYVDDEQDAKEQLELMLHNSKDIKHFNWVDVTEEE